VLGTVRNIKSLTEIFQEREGVMSRLRWIIGAGVVIMVLGMVDGASAQPGGRQLGGNIKFNSGQSIQPIFEGWSKDPDGRFVLYFGYLNRNHVEELAVPVGPDNSVEPGGPDRAQPTYFYPRFNRKQFTVTVPSDWGKKEVVWTVTVRGRTEKAVGWLQPEWEIDVTPRGSDRSVNNAPPTLAVDGGPSRVTLPAPLTLTATVSDDGLPKPAARPGGGGAAQGPPTFRVPPNPPSEPVNVPSVERKPLARNRGLTLTWFVWRGPAGVMFDPEVNEVKEGGKVAVTATFTKPGEYVLRARANDTAASATQDVTVTVSPR
jgi:hypothetical protein